MKKFFRLVSMLAVAGLTFTYTSCTDYSEDIDANKESIDAVKTEVDGKLSSLSEQLASVNKTIEQLKTTDAAAAKSVEALEASSAALKAQLETLEQKHADDKAALESSFAAEVTKINAAIAQLRTDYASADDALKAALEEKISANTDKIAALRTELEGKIYDLDKAYKEADAKLKTEILANATAISGIQSDIKTINEVTIPAARKQAEDLVNALKAETAETYATKAALSDSTAKVIKLVNTSVLTLTTRLESAEGRLTTLEAAQKALEDDLKKTKESYDAQIKTINADIAANKTAIALLGSDAAAVRKVLDSLDTRLKAAAAAAAAAQETADKAVADAAAAQTTADKAVAAAKTAHDAADAAQTTANEALGKVNTLIDALGVYAQKDSLKTRIEQMLEKDILLAQQAAELAAKDLELSGDIADLDAKVDSLIKAANARIDSVITAFDGKIAALAAADKKMGEDIAKLFDEKFDKSAFAAEFKTAYEARFGADFKKAYEARFSDDFDAAFTKAWNDKYEESFKEAFSASWNANFQTAFDNALDTVWDDKFKDSFDEAIKGYITAAAAEARIDEVKKNLEDLIFANTTKIAALNDKVDDEVARIDEALDDIRLVINELVSNRVQSIVFVPEYSDMKASFYYYTVDGTPVSDDKIVEATFEVYPKSAAATLNNDNVKVVAVNVGMRASAFVNGTILNDVKADANGRVTLKVKFGKELDYDSKKDIAIAMRVENDKEGYSCFVESAYVGVQKVKGSEIKDNYAIYNFTTKKEISAEELSKAFAWSVAPADSKFEPFKGYEIALKIGDKYYSLADAAKEFSIDEEDITPVLASTTKYYDAKSTSPAEKSGYNKYYSVPKEVVVAEGYGIAMTDEVQKKVAASTGVLVAEPVETYCETAITAKVAGKAIANLAKTVKYSIVKREAIITLKRTKDAGVYEFPWTYARAVALSSATDYTKAYDKPIGKDVDPELGEFLAEIVYPNGGDEFGFKEVITATGAVDTDVYREGDKVTLAGKSDFTLGYSVVSSVNAYIADVEITGYKDFFDGETYTLKNEYVHQSTAVTVQMDVKLGNLPKFGKVEVNTEKEPALLKYIAGKASVASVDAVAKAYDVADSAKVLFKDAAEFAASITASTVGYYIGNDPATLGTVTPGTTAAAGDEWQKACVKEAQRKDDNKSTYKELDATARTYTFLVPANGVVAKDSYGAETNGSYIRISCNGTVTNFDNVFGFVTDFTPWYGNGEAFSFIAFAKFDKPTYTLSFYGDKVTVDGTNGTVELVGTAKDYSFDINKDDLSKYVRVVNNAGTDKYTLGADYANLRVNYTLVTEEDADNGYLNLPAISGAGLSVDDKGAVTSNWVDWKTGTVYYTARDLEVKAALTYDGLAIGDPLNLTLGFADPVTMSLDGESGEGGKYTYNATRTPGKELRVNLWKYLVIKEAWRTNKDDNRVLLNTAAASFSAIWSYQANKTYDLGVEFELDRKGIPFFIPRPWLLKVSHHLCRKNERQNGNDKSNDSCAEDRLGGLRCSAAALFPVRKRTLNAEVL